MLFHLKNAIPFALVQNVKRERKKEKKNKCGKAGKRKRKIILILAVWKRIDAHGLKQ